MKTLAVVAGSFFAVSAMLIAYFAMSGAGQEYDLNFALRIDPRDIPKSILPSPVAPEIQGEPLTPDLASASDTGRAEAPEAARLTTAGAPSPFHTEDASGVPSSSEPRAQP